MKTSGLRAAMAIASLFGSFGDYAPPQQTQSYQIQGTSKFRNRGVKRRPGRKGHRRRYLCGKPWAR